MLIYSNSVADTTSFIATDSQFHHYRSKKKIHYSRPRKLQYFLCYISIIIYLCTTMICTQLMSDKRGVIRDNIPMVVHLVLGPGNEWSLLLILQCNSNLNTGERVHQCYLIVLASMGTSGFLACLGRYNGLNGIDHKVLELKGLHQVSVPHHSSIHQLKQQIACHVKKILSIQFCQWES